MSYAYDPSDVVLGVYDAYDRIAQRVASGVDVRVLVFPAHTTQQELPTIDSQLFDKDFFFERSTHVVIVVDNFQAISYAAAALGKLIMRQIRGLMIISKPELVDMMVSDTTRNESAEISKCIAERRLIVCESFDRINLGTFLGT